MIQFLFFVLFWVFTGIYILIVALKKSKLEPIIIIIFPLLILYYLFGVPLSKVDWLIVFGLVCGLIANLFFMSYENESMFLNGLIIRLIENFFYILSFTQSFMNFSGFQLWKLLLLIPGIIIIVFTYLRIKGEMQLMKMAIFIYMGVLSVMYVCSVLRLPASEGLDYWFVWIGTTIYMISAAIIAIDTLDQKIPSTGVFILSTYFIAIYLIVQGYIFHGISTL
jgi:hypothetical protein